MNYAKEVWTARLAGTGWVVELGSLNGRVLRQFPFWHGVRLLFPYSLFFFFCLPVDSTPAGRLKAVSAVCPTTLEKFPPSYCFTYFHLLLAWPLGSLLAHARPTDISDFTGSRPGSAGDGFVISNRLGGVDSYIAGFQEQLLLQISSSDATKTSSRVSFFILQGNVHLELRRESLLLRQRIDYHIVCFISKINV